MPSIASAVLVSGQGQQTPNDGSSPVPELALLLHPAQERSQPGCFTVSSLPGLLLLWVHLCPACHLPGKGIDSESLSRNAGVGVGQVMRQLRVTALPVGEEPTQRGQ